MPNLTAANEEISAPSRLCICSECEGRFVLTYIWIDYCPGCGCKFDHGEHDMPIVLMSDGSEAKKEHLSGYHQLKVYGKIGVE